MSEQPPLRVGVVSYLNMLPLTHGMESLGSAGAPLAVIPVPPAPMARMMEDGQLDVGMLPVGALVGRADWEIVGHSMIGSEGPVLSVVAVGRGDPSSWSVIHPDSHSRTSNVLARVVLERCYKVRPETGLAVPMDGWSPPEFSEGEAFVLIGTRALRWRSLRNDPSLTVLDLGEEWTRWTGLPFIFALWTARRGVELGDWPERFEALKRKNLARLRAVVEAWPGLSEERLTTDEAVAYLTRNIRFDLDDRALAGFRRFYDEGRALGLFEPGWSLQRALLRD